ncbi:MAG: ABC transporter ATP-binding protein, partial [Alphaproteobacteria bacterium]|nr:ABC transporter ATP-binding protein [Alphaproteobacteria bacterium]
VTHDQTEALTFADQVVVMHEGAVVQVGTPVELFETPRHTFVGHFIGSPGMNVLPCTLEDGGARFSGHAVETRGFTEPKAGYRQLELGVRPEFVSFADDGIPVKIVKVSDTGRHRIVETRFEDVPIRLLVPEGEPLAADDAHVRFDPGHTQVYADGWMVDGGQP